LACPHSCVRNSVWLDEGTRRIRFRVDPHPSVDDLRLERRDFLRKWRWRSSCLRQVLIAMPRASHASIDNLALPQWTVLVAAYVRNRRDLAVKLEYGDAFAAHGDNCGALLRNAFH